ncbi:MAG: hypothetical protein LUH82_02255 [Clostridiales bacterium]|nr:hypothetical protein [Clostridiales bacterium]MCD7722764.1 hypothetical protein [Clostridiales bacterium]
MEREFYTISVYVDKDENLIGIPCGDSEKYLVGDIDKVILLKKPYGEKEVEKFIDSVFDSCYSKRHNDESEISTIEKYTKKKGFVNATADLTLISLVKTQNSISIMPTFNDSEKGPLCIDDDERVITLPYNAGELYEQINDIIMVYVKANAFYKIVAEIENEKDGNAN